MKNIPNMCENAKSYPGGEVSVVPLFSLGELCTSLSSTETENQSQNSH